MRPSIVAGIGVGLATGSWMFAEYALGLHDDSADAGRWTGFLSLAFPVLGAYWIASKAVLPSWLLVLREGLVFGALGGLLGAVAIYLYFTVVNPDFSVDGKTVDAGTQALIGFVGSLVLAPTLTFIMVAVARRRSRAHG